MKGNVNDLLNKLSDKLRDGREDHIAEVKSMERSLKSATLRKNFSEHPAAQQLIAMIKKREASYSTLLANKEDATTEERMSWFARRKECRFFLRFFESADQTIESIRKTVEYQLSDDVDNAGVNSGA